MTRGFLLALTAASLAASPTEAITRCVRPQPYPGCYPSIQAAVDESISGDVIQLAAGVYFENVVIPGGKDGLQILGAGKLATIIDPDAPLTGNAFTVGSNGVRIRNLGIRNGQAHGIFLSGASGVVIQGLRIVGLRGPSSAGIFGLGSTGAQLLGNEIRAVRRSGIVIGGGNVDWNIVAQNTATRCSQAGIYVYGNQTLVERNLISGTFENGITVELSRNVVVTGNTATGNAAQGIAVLSGSDDTLVTGNTARGNRRDFCDDGTGTSASGNTFGSSFATPGVDCTLAHLP